MKNIFLLILLIIFLYIICNEYIENFSVGCQSNGQGNGQDDGQGNDNKINISSNLTLSYQCKCSGSSLNIEKLNIDTQKYYHILYSKYNNVWHMERNERNKPLDFCIEEIDYVYKIPCDESIITLLKCIYNIFKIKFISIDNNNLQINADKSVKIKITFSNNESVIINIFIKKDKSWASEKINIENKGKIISIELLTTTKL